MGQNNIVKNAINKLIEINILNDPNWSWQLSGKGSILANTDDDETVYALSDLVSDTENLNEQQVRLLHTAPNSNGETQIFRTQSNATLMIMTI